MSSSSRQHDPGGPIDILLVEDNLGDIRLIQEAFNETDTETRFHPITNGDDAIDFLNQRYTEDPMSLPDLALIDLNLPGKDGCEVLEAIKADPHLRHLPVIILTSSSDRDDVARCYNAKANAYLTKPTSPDEFTSLVKAVERFWFKRVQLPPIPA